MTTMIAKARGTVIDEIDDQVFPPTEARNAVFRFRGMRAYFQSLNGSQELVKAHLLSLLKDRWRTELELVPPPMIGIHVRLGDFSGHQRHSIGWFIAALDFVRTNAGRQVAATVFSDGSPLELAPLLQVPDVHLARTSNAATDLLSLARSRFLIATGSSTFSAWAAYLGQIPALTHAGNPLSWWNLVNMRGHFIGQWNPEAADQQLVADIREVFGSH